MKKPKVTIATHSGQFHADDIFGTATLCLVLEGKHEIEIVRTRDKEIIEKADYVLDVGHIYNPEVNRFDHHQGTAGGHENGIPYAAFGLVWKKYGEVVAGNKQVAFDLEQKIVTPIDALDNGKEISKPTIDSVHAYTIDSVIGAYRLTWKEGSDELYNRFIFLVDFAKQIIAREIKQIQDKEEAKGKLLEIYTNSEDKRLIILDRYYPWSEVMSSYDDTRLVIYPDITGGNWCIEVVRDEEFVNTRISLPQSWSGKRDKVLEDVTGIVGSVFCHIDRFFAVAKTKESAIELAHIALSEAGK